MKGEADLTRLMATLTARLVAGTYVFVTVAPEDVPAGLTPRMMFREEEGTTLIILRKEAQDAGLKFEFPCRMITLDVHSSLDAVGFIARIATRLAEHGMGVNPVSGFYHDHLFVPEGREKEAMALLEEMAG